MNWSNAFTLSRGCISSKSNDKKEFINRDETINRIKEAKDLFDTGILSQEEYDELVAKYKAIIMAN